MHASLFRHGRSLPDAVLSRPSRPLLGPARGRRTVVAPPSLTHRRLARRRRRGFTLVEILAVGVILSGIAFASLRLLDAVDHLQQGMQQDAQSVRDLQRFADRFRDDLAAAESFRREADKQAIELTMPADRPRVQYRIVDQTVRRREVGTATADRTLAFDGYRLPPGGQASWQIARQPAVVRLDVVPSDARFPAFQIEGVTPSEV